MDKRRRLRGFERVGRLPTSQLGLPAARGRELRLAHAWRQLAGAPLSSHARARRVVRGTLDVEVDERSWFDAVAPLMAKLAWRLSTACPELSIRRYRLILAGQDRLPEPLDLAPDDGEPGSEVGP